jgi:hypothetical protein
VAAGDDTVLTVACGACEREVLALPFPPAGYRAHDDDPDVGREVRCRLRQCTEEGALAFQFAVPDTPARTLTDLEYLSQWRHSYGLDQPMLVGGTRCASTCATHGPRCAVDQAEFASGVHMLHCRSAKPLGRHNRCGREVLKPLYIGMGYSFNEHLVHCHVNSGKRVDARCANSAVSHRDEALDFTIGCPMAETYVTAAAEDDRHATTAALERGKRAKHAAAAAVAGMQYVTCALTTFGGWGEEFLKRHVRPEYARRRKAEKAEGGLGWKTQAWKQALFENMNIVIARSNYEMLAMHTLPAEPQH